MVTFSPIDNSLMKLLETKRDRGRNDYPIRPCWNALLAGIIFQHRSAAELLRELRRNAELRQVCGFDPLLGVKAVPSDDAFGHFLLISPSQAPPRSRLAPFLAAAGLVFLAV